MFVVSFTCGHSYRVALCLACSAECDGLPIDDLAPLYGAVVNGSP